MANNYLLFSEAIKSITPEEENWLRQKYDEGPQDDPDGWDCYNFDMSIKDQQEGRYMLVHAGESGSPEHVGEFVQEFFRKFRPRDVFTLTWAEYCDRPRVGEFGGGAIMVTAENIKAMDVGDWVNDQLKEWKRRQT